MVSASTRKISPAKVYFFYDSANPLLKNRTRLKKFIEQLFKLEGKKLGSLNYVFCTDKKLLEINRRHLRHDFYTDIITFDLSENQGTISGEIYISVDRVKDNARKLGIPFSSEILRVIFHGALHLCGYDDKSQKEVKKMRRAEDLCLSRYLKNRFM